MTEPTRTLKVLALYPDGTTAYCGLDDEEINYKFLVAGPVGVMHIGADVFGLVHADGKRSGLPDNNVATELVERLNPTLLLRGERIYGPLVVVGALNEQGRTDGKFYDVPDRVAELFKKNAA